MKNWKDKGIAKTLLFVGIGAVFGFVWHRTIGCSTGACPISANPYISTAYGAVAGLVLRFG